MNKVANYGGAAVVALSAFASASGRVVAQSCSGTLEFLNATPLAVFCGRDLRTPGELINSLIQSGITVFFIVVLIVAVFYTLKAALTYIRSEGNEQKVEGAKNAMKSILFGVGSIVAALLGLIVLNSFFSSESGGGLVKAINDIFTGIRGTT